MTLLYFEGFDAHIDPVFSGLDVGAGSMQDAGVYWTGGTPQHFPFVEGYLEGNAYGVGYTGQKWSTSNISGANATRVGFWARGNNNTTPFGLVVFGRTTNDNNRVIRVNSDGSLSVTNRAYDEFGRSNLGAWGGSTWKHYEFLIERSGHFEARVNGALVINVNTPAMTTGMQVNLGYGWLPGNVQQRYDHLYITDGPPLEGSEVYGVQVVAAQDQYKGLNSGLHGCLIIAGERYLKDFQRAAVSTEFPYADGDNLANVLNWCFSRNPSTGMVWDKASLRSIEQWGLCYQRSWIGTGGEIRVPHASLAVLESSTNGPIVKHYLAGGVTSFSGPWRKSSPSLSFSEHIRPIPRRDDQKVADNLSLFIGDTGCIFFQPTFDEQEEPFKYVGLTFAEEFREDYRDWVRIDSLGQAFESYFITGYSVLGEGNRKFQDNYVTINYENVPTGRAYIQGIWDYAESGNTGRWSSKQTIENKGGDYTHAHRRVKIRGHGKALSFKITNYGDRPFTINGWTVLASSNQSP